VRPIKENESGLWATPNTMDHLPPRSKEGTIKLMQGQRKGRTRPSNLREQVDPETMKLWRTPDAHCERGQSSPERMKMKLEKKLPISINDQVALRGDRGSLNPQWVEWLMGYPAEHTDLEDWAMLSCHKSQKK